MEVIVVGILKRCPNCNKVYETELELTDKAAQVSYPNESAWKREQLISGLCSDKCWNEYLGIRGMKR